MKKAMIGLSMLLLTMSQAFAHPTDNDLIDLVGIGSKLIIL